jgi:hypothetical protein
VKASVFAVESLPNISFVKRSAGRTDVASAAVALRRNDRRSVLIMMPHQVGFGLKHAPLDLIR